MKKYERINLIKGWPFSAHTHTHQPTNHPHFKQSTLLQRLHSSSTIVNNSTSNMAAAVTPDGAPVAINQVVEQYQREFQVRFAHKKAMS